MPLFCLLLKARGIEVGYFVACFSLHFRQFMHEIFWHSVVRCVYVLTVTSSWRSANWTLPAQWLSGSGCLLSRQAADFQGCTEGGEHAVGIGQAKMPQSLLFLPRFKHSPEQIILGLPQFFGYFPEFWKGWFWQILSVLSLLLQRREFSEDIIIPCHFQWYHLLIHFNALNP